MERLRTERQRDVLDGLQVALPRASWDRNGNVYSLELYSADRMREEDWERLRDLSRLEYIEAFSVHEWDSALASLASISTIKRINLHLIPASVTFPGFDATAGKFLGKVSDSTLERLAQLPRLHTLVLEGAVIRGEQVKYLARMRSLQYLSLFETRLGLDELRQLGTLHELEDLRIKTTVSEETAKRELQRILPGCRIVISRTTWGDGAAEGVDAETGEDDLHGGDK